MKRLPPGRRFLPLKSILRGDHNAPDKIQNTAFRRPAVPARREGENALTAPKNRQNDTGKIQKSSRSTKSKLSFEKE